MQILEVDGHEFEMVKEDFDGLYREIERVQALGFEQFFFKFENHPEVVVLNMQFAKHLLEYLYGKDI